MTDKIEDLIFSFDMFKGHLCKEVANSPKFQLYNIFIDS